eukprot:CAMPEP_0113527768 /NCGR_PEP_ID=MMETSP0015_2-20120614/1475_1 /TAXON_ID=2838 /ORGANISM="Odontella" /LENGTH=141 /DNA_ID=CAMNT_0000426231 /DNA_START=581 /DNA_END=1003 /DNA_ORIENTATION=- /assembly_acc=CAM_ASM_000160
MTCDDTKRNELAFNLGLDMGYPSPHFVQRAKQHGTLTVYHGTNPENLWSILTYGLQSLSNTRLSKNGAIMGHGVYLTTSKKVALFFANSDSCTKSVWWNHASFLRLIPNSYYSGSLEHCTVSCAAVLEATIVAPSTECDSK